MVGLVLGIHVEGQSQLVIALQACTLFVTLERLLRVAISMLGSSTLRFLLDSLAIARDKDFVLTGFVFFTDRWEVTWRHAWMPTDTQLLATGLSARLFTLSWPVALLLAFVCSTLKSLSAHVSTPDIRKPAWLILQHILAA